MQTSRAIKVAGVLALGGFSLCGCVQNTESKKVESRKVEAQKNSGPSMELKKVESSVVNAGNEFGFDLLRKINAASSQSNLLISPFSLSSALAMTLNGAAGATQKEMAQTLRLGVLPLADVNAANAALKFNLATTIPQHDPRIELTIANSLWAKKGVNFNPAFLSVNKKFYDAKTTSLDLSTAAATDAMNDWVKQNTQGKIEKMFDTPPDADARLILLNAVYFNGKWQNQFDKSETRDAPFYLQNKKQKPVPMMSREGEYSYVKTKEAAIVELPYGNGDLSLVLVLPDKNVALDSLLSTISAKNWNQWRSEMSSQEGEVSIPRFKMEFEIQLGNTLQEMGMPSAFSPAADFSKMRAQKDLFISEVKQKTFIEINEEGSEAAAVTESTITSKSAEDNEPFRFIADRPFFGAICEKNSGAILFLLIVREP